VLHGILWLYPDHLADAWLAAIDAVPSTASRELLSGELEVKSPWFQRDVPMSLDTLIENFVDPSHVPHSHHGVVVSSRGQGRRAQQKCRAAAC
jgi:phenylpropionate dioxygenase-like ring-hydroxylating dioxygenase large terminal subunit